MVEIDRHYLRVREVAERLSLDESTVYKMLKAESLPSIRLGKAVRVPAGALATYLRRLERGGALVRLAPIEERVDLGSLDDRAHEFHRRVGLSPHEFIEGWKRGEIEDTAENAAVAIEALALRNALDREPVTA